MVVAILIQILQILLLINSILSIVSELGGLPSDFYTPILFLNMLIYSCGMKILELTTSILEGKWRILN